MTTNQDIIDAAKRLSDYTKDARGRESFDFDNYSVVEFAELLTQSLRQEWAESLNRRVEVEQVLLNVSAGKRPVLTQEECKALALKLGVPDSFRERVK